MQYFKNDGMQAELRARAATPAVSPKKRKAKVAEHQKNAPDSEEEDQLDSSDSDRSEKREENRKEVGNGKKRVTNPAKAARKRAHNALVAELSDDSQEEQPARKHRKRTEPKKLVTRHHRYDEAQQAELDALLQHEPKKPANWTEYDKEQKAGWRQKREKIRKRNFIIHRDFAAREKTRLAARKKRWEERGDRPEESGAEGDASSSEEEDHRAARKKKALSKARGKKRQREDEAGDEEDAEEEEVDQIESDNEVDVKPRIGEEWACPGCTYHVRSISHLDRLTLAHFSVFFSYCDQLQNGALDETCIVCEEGKRDKATDWFDVKPDFRVGDV